MTNSTLVKKALGLLSETDRRKYRFAVLLQMATSILDLLGVLLFGVVGLLAASAAQSTPVPSSISRLLDVVGLGDASLMRASAVLAACAAVLLIVKSALALVINRRVMLFLARCAAELSQRLSDQFFELPIYRVQQESSQFSAFALSQGVNAMIIDTLTGAMTVRSELALLTVLSVSLLVIDPVTTVVVVVYFGLVVMLLSRGLARWSRETGFLLAETDIAAIASVQDGIATYREITVAGNRRFFADRFQALRRAGTRAFADQRLIMILPRYVMETAMVVGAVLMVAITSATQDTQQAFASLALFLTASSRVLPSLLRLNSARLSIHAAVGRAERTLAIEQFCREHLPSRVLTADATPDVAGDEQDPPPTAIAVRGLAVRYPGAEEDALSGVDLIVPPGTSVALVGPSGAGKSTLADAILGVVPPTRGSITIGGLAVSDLIRLFPGSVAYVPQEVALISGTVRDNVALGIESNRVDDGMVWDALRKARLDAFLVSTREGLDTVIGERGVRLSGGQRQRLGIARAVYSNPRLIVLDEATSALDAETEHVVTATLGAFTQDITTVTVAHRLATVRDADVVLYLEKGQVVARGSFEEVRSQVPQFDHQARLLGL